MLGTDALSRATEMDPDQVRRAVAQMSPADLEVVLRERASWEPLDEVPADACLTLRTDRDVGATLTDLTALVDPRVRA